jgi:hypothetical protein
MFCVLFVITLYYNIINTWTLFYLGSSFYSPVLWSRCNEEWNTLECINGLTETNYNSTMLNMSVSLNQSLLGSNHPNYSTAVGTFNGTLNSTKGVGTSSEEQFWL